MSEDDNEPRLLAILTGIAILLLAVCCANLAGLSSAQSAARPASSRCGCRSAPAPAASCVNSPLSGYAGRRRRHGWRPARPCVHQPAGGGFFAVDDEGHPLRYAFGETPAIGSLTIGAALVAALVISVGPAIRAVRRAAPGASTPRSTASRRWTGAWLLGAQATAAVAMVALAALFAVSAQTMVSGGNYDGSHLALLRLRPRLLKYPPERAQRFQREVVERLAALPSVESVSLVGIGAVLTGSGRDRAAGVDRRPAGVCALTRSARATSRRCRRHSSAAASSTTPICRSHRTSRSSTKRWRRVSGRRQGARRDAARQRDAASHRRDRAGHRLGSRTAPPESWVYTPFWQNTGESIRGWRSGSPVIRRRCSRLWCAK